jgi:hypothetical protein
VLIAVLLLFAACKGESPTAPSPGGGTPGGGTTPPTGVNVVLSSTSNTPLVDATVTITATVTDNGQPVANGTAVEFSSTSGVLNGGGTSIIKTTTNGVATVTLTTGTAGVVRVTAIVNNVIRTIDVNFQPRSTTPQPPSTAPTITSITPNVGKPTGGQIIRITGKNFKPTVKVLFRTPNTVVPIEASVVAVTDTTIDVVTPPVNLGAGQQLVADVIVFTQVGSGSEASVESTGGFTFRNESLTPIISTVSPNSGPVTGDTRVTIFGEAFQDPVQVLFGTAEARVLNVTYNKILVDSPAGRDTSSDGSGPVLGSVDVTVRNINSNQAATLTAGFNYKSAIVITAAGPTIGPPTGGTRVSIDGNGFVAPVAVSIGGVAAQPIFVSGTKIIAQTGGVTIVNCGDVQGPITVTNIANGETATGPIFVFDVQEPIIVSVTGPTPTVPGSPISVRVLNAGAFPQIRIGDRGVPVTGSTPNGDGTTTLTATVPTTISLDTEACPGGGSRDIPTTFDVTFTSQENGCTTTLEGALTVEPAQIGRLSLAPNPLTIPATGDDPATIPDEEVDGTGTFTITNTGGADLTITSVVSNNPNFTTANPAGTVLAPCESVVVAVTYEAGPRGSTDTAIITVSATSNATPLTARETVVGRTN